MFKRLYRFFGSAGRQINRLARSNRKMRSKPSVSLHRDGQAGSESESVAVFPESGESERLTGLSSEEPRETARPPKRKRKKSQTWVAENFKVPPVPGKSRFHDFAIDSVIMHGIADLEFQYCTPIQAEALPVALAGKDLIGRAQTGTGKTAVFMITLLCRLLADNDAKLPPGRPRALVVAPTRELVVQIVRDGRKLGRFSRLALAAVFGGTNYQKQESLLLEHPFDVIVATPGRLLDFIRKEIIVLDNCSMLVIDEADRMLDMGFMPDIRSIVARLPERSKRQTMFFSATVTDDVRRLADRWCVDPVFLEAGEETVDVGKIEQRIYLTTETEKFILLYNLIAGAEQGRILVFENMKREASRLAEKLRDYGISCQVLTGDVPQHKRLARLEAFRSGKNRLLIATDVAGRGIHVDDIEYVVNYSVPFEPENYVHRIGRTGRAGASGIAVSFACEKGSFNIPDIEELIGRRLPCVVPGEELLAPLPEPTKRPSRRRKNSGRRNSRRRAKTGKGTNRSA